MSKLYLTEPQESLFQDRMPLRPYCTNDLSNGLKIRGRDTALKMPYIQVNPPVLKFWLIFDIDRPASGFAWEDANLPTPAWVSQNRKNGHCHMAWGLSAPVLTTRDARLEPLRYLAAIEGAFRHELKADTGFSGLITKNPLNPQWLSYVGDTTLHEMGYLADFVDLKKHTLKQGVKPEEYGLGRNCFLFEQVRHWSYRAIRLYKREVRGDIRVWNAWRDEVYKKTLERNGDFITPLEPRECWHISHSIAKWVWRNMDWQAFIARTHTPEIQSARGKRGNLAKWGNNEDKKASAKLMRAKGMTQSAIAKELNVSLRTIKYWTQKRGNRLLSGISACA
jgi:hypothetical protein